MGRGEGREEGREIGREEGGKKGEGRGGGGGGGGGEGGGEQRGEGGKRMLGIRVCQHAPTISNNSPPLLLAASIWISLEMAWVHLRYSYSREHLRTRVV